MLWVPCTEYPSRTNEIEQYLKPTPSKTDAAADETARSSESRGVSYATADQEEQDSQHDVRSRAAHGSNQLPDTTIMAISRIESA